jgi:hypothetical protein
MRLDALNDHIWHLQLYDRNISTPQLVEIKVHIQSSITFTWDPHLPAPITPRSFLCIPSSILFLLQLFCYLTGIGAS